jgi:hypothetical protein
MAQLSDESIAERAQKRESLRMSNVSSRLTHKETGRLDALAKKRGQHRGKFIRQLILDELARESGDPPVSRSWSKLSAFGSCSRTFSNHSRRGRR